MLRLFIRLVPNFQEKSFIFFNSLESLRWSKPKLSFKKIKYDLIKQGKKREVGKEKFEIKIWKNNISCHFKLRPSWCSPNLK